MEVSKNVTVIPARKHTRKSKDEEKPKLRVAAYCRVSTDSDEQATSYDAQIEHYTAYINGHPDWELAGIYADADTPYGLNPKSPQPRLCANGYGLFVLQQEVLMQELGVDKVFIDYASGKSIDRAQLKEMLQFIREGDTPQFNHHPQS